jgi:hypothetical protein
MLAIQRLRRKEMNKYINDDSSKIVVHPPSNPLEFSSFGSLNVFFGILQVISLLKNEV